MSCLRSRRDLVVGPEQVARVVHALDGAQPRVRGRPVERPHVRLALDDLLKTARIGASRTFQTNEHFFWAAIGYLLLTVGVTLVVRRLEARYAIRR